MTNCLGAFVALNSDMVERQNINVILKRENGSARFWWAEEVVKDGKVDGLCLR